jgi:hypothetical protein
MAKSIRLDAPESRAEVRREPLDPLETGRRLWLSQDRRSQARPVAGPNGPPLISAPGPELPSGTMRP